MQNARKALMAIQEELKAPKGQFNKFGGYYYRSCEDILEAVKPLLVKNKCLLTISDEIKEVGGRIYVCATAEINTEDGDGYCTTGWAREEAEKKGMDDSQITGAASSYARKYALNGLFAIDDAKDSDSTNEHGKTTPKAPTPPTPPTPPKSNNDNNDNAGTSGSMVIGKIFFTAIKDDKNGQKFVSLGFVCEDGQKYYRNVFVQGIPKMLETLQVESIDNIEELKGKFVSFTLNIKNEPQGIQLTNESFNEQK